MFFSMVAENFFETPNRSPSTCLDPLLENLDMLSSHKGRHQIVNRASFYFLGRKPEKLAYVKRNISDCSHSFGVDKCFDSTRSFVKNKFSELFDRTKLISLIAVVDFFEVSLQLSTIVEETYL